MPPFTRRRREGGGGGGGRRRSHSFTATSTTGQAFTIKSRFLRQQGFNARHSLRGLRYVCTTSTGLETLSPRQMVRDSPFQTITVTEFPATTTTDDEAPNLCRYANKWHRSGRVQKTHNAIRALRAIVSQSNHDRAFTSHRLDGRVAPGQTPPPLLSLSFAGRRSRILRATDICIANTNTSHTHHTAPTLWVAPVRTSRKAIILLCAYCAPQLSIFSLAILPPPLLSTPPVIQPRGDFPPSRRNDALDQRK